MKVNFEGEWTMIKMILKFGKKFGIELNKQIERRNRDIADKILYYANQNLVEGKAIYRGHLRASGKVRRTETSQSLISVIEKFIFNKELKKNIYRVGYNVPYATIIEYGWRPLNPDWYPPFEKIKRWVRIKLKIKERLEAVTWKVIKKMKRVGYPNPRLGVSPRDFFYRAVRRVKTEYRIRQPIPIYGKWGQIVRLV